MKNFEMELQPHIKEINERKARLEKLAVEANLLATATIQHRTAVIQHRAAEILTHLDSRLFQYSNIGIFTLLN